MNKSFVIASLIAAAALAACGKKEEPQQVEAAPVAVPTTEDKTAWNAYLNDVAGRHMEGINNTPFIYLVPPPAGTDTSTMEGLQAALPRGGWPGGWPAAGRPGRTACRAVFRGGGPS